MSAPFLTPIPAHFFPQPFPLAALQLPPDAWWAASVVVLSLVGFLGAWNTRWRAAAGWAALALAGQACALELLWAGHSIRLQMFQGWGVLLKGWRAPFFAAVFLQGAIVAWGAWREWVRGGGGGWTAVRQLLTVPGFILFFVMALYGAVTIAPEVAQALIHGGLASRLAVQSSKLALAVHLLAVNTANLALAASAIPADALENLSMRWANRSEASRRRLPWLAAAWVVVISSLLAWVVFERTTHLADEVCYLFQAKYFSTGALWLPPPPDSESLYAPFHLNEGGKWYGTPPAGWGMALALGVWAGVPWLVNPLLGGIAVLLAHRLVLVLYDRDAADATALLLAASPWLLFLSASLMMHPVTLVCSLLALLGVAQARAGGSPAWGALAGAGSGALLHVRPLEAVVVAAVGGIWWLAAGLRNIRWGSVAAAIAAGAAMTALMLGYNHALTGNYFEMPLERYLNRTVYEGANRPGFGPHVGNFGWTGIDALPGHGPIDVVMNNNQALYMTGFELFGWSCGSLLFVYLLAAKRGLRGHGLMWGLVLGVAAAMSTYWNSGVPDFGARYWYQMIAPLVALTVLGARDLAGHFAEQHGPAASRRVWAFVALATMLAVVTVVPWRSLDKYYGYRSVNGEFRRLAEEKQFGRSVVFVQFDVPSDFSPAFALNPSTFERDVPGTIFARLTNAAAVERIRAFYSDRPVWIVRGASLNPSGKPEVAAGPIAPGEALPPLPIGDVQ